MIRVAIADDHALFRQGLAELLSGIGDFEVVGMAANGAEALSMTEALKPRVLILDISMPVMNGFEVARRIKDRRLPVKVLVLSMHKDQFHLKRALEFGVDGYLLKDEAFEELARAVAVVAGGGRFISPPARAILEEFPQVHGRGVLSPRERQVVAMIAAGQSTKEIAAELHVSIKTVETHRHHIMEKLGCRKAAQIVAQAIKAGIID